MALELVYTSVPKGLKPGSMGFCTVACSRALNDRTIAMLERLSTYRRASDDAKDCPVVFAHLLVEDGGSTRRVLSRVGLSGLDYSNRENKIACHFVLDFHDLSVVGPAELCAAPNLFAAEWTAGPQYFDRSIVLPTIVETRRRCDEWERTTGDPGWAGVLASTAYSGQAVLLIVDPTIDVLALYRESIALLPRDRRWDVTFSTYYTKTAPGVRCQWKAVMKGSPEEEALRGMPNTVKIDLTEPHKLRSMDKLTRAAGVAALVAEARSIETTAPTKTRSGGRAHDSLAVKDASNATNIGANLPIPTPAPPRNDLLPPEPPAPPKVDDDRAQEPFELKRRRGSGKRGERVLLVFRCLLWAFIGAALAAGLTFVVLTCMNASPFEGLKGYIANARAIKDLSEPGALDAAKENASSNGASDDLDDSSEDAFADVEQTKSKKDFMQDISDDEIFDFPDVHAMDKKDKKKPGAENDNAKNGGAKNAESNADDPNEEPRSESKSRTDANKDAKSADASDRVEDEESEADSKTNAKSSRKKTFGDSSADDFLSEGVEDIKNGEKNGSNADEDVTLDQDEIEATEELANLDLDASVGEETDEFAASVLSQDEYRQALELVNKLNAGEGSVDMRLFDRRTSSRGETAVVEEYFIGDLRELFQGVYRAVKAHGGTIEAYCNIEADPESARKFTNSRERRTVKRVSFADVEDKNENAEQTQDGAAPRSFVFEIVDAADNGAEDESEAPKQGTFTIKFTDNENDEGSLLFAFSDVETRDYFLSCAKLKWRFIFPADGEKKELAFETNYAQLLKPKKFNADEKIELEPLNAFARAIGETTAVELTDPSNIANARNRCVLIVEHAAANKKSAKKEKTTVDFTVQGRLPSGSMFDLMTVRFAKSGNKKFLDPVKIINADALYDTLAEYYRRDLLEKRPPVASIDGKTRQFTKADVEDQTEKLAREQRERLGGVCSNAKYRFNLYYAVRADNSDVPKERWIKIGEATLGSGTELKIEQRRR